MRLGLTSENQALFIGVTPNSLTYIDFVSANAIQMSSATAIALPCTKQGRRAW
jgi:hypothetical protein